MPKEQFSAKQWKLGAERRCIACVAKAGSDESAWTTVGAADGKDPKKDKKKENTTNNASPKATPAPAKVVADAEEEAADDEDDGFEEVTKKKVSKKKMKDNPGFANLKAAA